MSSDEHELNLRQRLSGLSRLPLLRGARVSGEAERLEQQLARLQAETSDEEIWRSVELARHPDRPYTLDYVERMLDDWVELHGDRGRADDGAMVTGIGSLDGRTVVVIGNQKGRDVKERIARQFGMPYPEGYVKAMRVMEIGARFGFPIVSLVDTPGAYPGVAAEQHGQGGAIARSQATMVRLGVPTIACIIGEGGSGGAVAIAVCDRVLMQENAIYSVITPEGCAAILWRDAGEAKKAAAAFKPDARHCLDLGVVDGIVPEPPGGAQTDHDEAARLLKAALAESLEELDQRTPRISSAAAGPSSAAWAYLPSHAARPRGGGARHLTVPGTVTERATGFHSIHSLFNREASVPKRVGARVKAGPERLTPRQVEKLTPLLARPGRAKPGFATPVSGPRRCGKVPACRVPSGRERSPSGSSPCPCACSRRPSRRSSASTSSTGAT